MGQDYVLNKDYFIDVIKDLIVLAEEKRDYFTGLDSAIGDGDHGINLSIGFREVEKNLEEWAKEDLTTFFRKVGMALLSKVGGSAGPLYGSFFMKFGTPANGKDEVNFQEFYEMFKVAVESIEARGKAVVGEKTMVDALRPGLDAFEKAIEEGLAPKEAFNKFKEAANEGADSTIPLVAKKGRAMRLGERAVGHKDPGAASSAAFIETFYNKLP
ncbi:MAG: dihydroxyacetone kinase subunit L [Clostridiales bacterium]|jgi:dihydroxyacetone kinase-like protein|nr:dihydroxyacetone kinase subunit L [Clostridiales bacterium]